MNLHSIRARFQAAIWTRTVGGNGHHLGTHLWVYDQQDPPDESEPDIPYNGLRSWIQPPRFSWRPYNPDIQFPYDNHYNRPWERPLCGKRSAARAVRYSRAPEWRTDYVPCQGCATAARERGIIPLWPSQAEQQNPTFSRLAQERTVWRNAG